MLTCVQIQFKGHSKEIATTNQKDSGTNPLPPLINVAGCQNMCNF